MWGLIGDWLSSQICTGRDVVSCPAKIHFGLLPNLPAPGSQFEAVWGGLGGIPELLQP